MPDFYTPSSLLFWDSNRVLLNAEPQHADKDRIHHEHWQEHTHSHEKKYWERIPIVFALSIHVHLYIRQMVGAIVHAPTNHSLCLLIHLPLITWIYLY